MQNKKAEGEGLRKVSKQSDIVQLVVFEFLQSFSRQTVSVHKLVKKRNVNSLEVLQTWQLFFKVLSEVEKLLAELDELTLIDIVSTGLKQILKDLFSHQLLLSHLFANLESNINCGSTKVMRFL